MAHYHLNMYLLPQIPLRRGGPHHRADPAGRALRRSPPRAQRLFRLLLRVARAAVPRRRHLDALRQKDQRGARLPDHRRRAAGGGHQAGHGGAKGG